MNRPVYVAFTVAAIATVAAAVLVSVANRRSAADTPQGTVRAFLVSSVVNQNGYGACRYLSRSALLEASRRESPEHAGCQASFSGAELRLGDTQIEQQSQVDDLAYTVAWDGHEQAAVTVSGYGGSHTFRLRYGSVAELNEFQDPPTSWRIYAGATALLPELTPPGRAERAPPGA